MKKKLQPNIDEIEKKLVRVYFDYFTNYLLFSKQYYDLNNQGLLDNQIKSDYIYHLYNQILLLKEENIYPSRIISNFLELIAVLEKRANEILTEKEKDSLSSLFSEMRTILEMILPQDQTQVYYDEYVKRYCSMQYSNQLMGISVKRLEGDIQRDFLYLDILIFNGLKSIDLIGSDFYSFLQKLFIDFPEVKFELRIKNNLESILKTKEDQEAKDYLHLLKDKYSYRNELGFCEENVEVLYCDTFIKKLIYTSQPLELIKKTDPNLFYSSAFYYALVIDLNTYTETKKITPQEKEAFQILIEFIRENMEKYAPLCKNELISILNAWIRLFNTCRVSENNDCLYSKQIIKSNDNSFEWIFAKKESGEMIRTRVKFEIEICHDLMNYFFLEESEKENAKIDLCEAGAYTVSALESLFHDYPKMFFDSTIYKRSIELLEEIGPLDRQKNKQKQKLKSKFNRIKKDN